jgi:hypothetical protein
MREQVKPLDAKMTGERADVGGDVLDGVTGVLALYRHRPTMAPQIHVDDAEARIG